MTSLPTHRRRSRGVSGEDAARNLAGMARKVSWVRPRTPAGRESPRPGYARRWQTGCLGRRRPAAPRPREGPGCWPARECARGTQPPRWPDSVPGWFRPAVEPRGGLRPPMAQGWQRSRAPRSQTSTGGFPSMHSTRPPALTRYTRPSHATGPARNRCFKSCEKSSVPSDTAQPRRLPS